MPSLRLAVIALLSFVLLSACKGAVPPEAQPAAEAWVALVDAGRYAESWTEAAAHFKASVDSASWEKMAGAVRGPIGPMKSRALKGAQPAKSLPGAPDGEYVVFQFDTSFEKKVSAVETLTVSKETDGTWRVSGYFIK